VQVALGLLAALLIGTSDFLGARASGKTTALQTTTAAFLGGAVVVAVYSPFLGDVSAVAIGMGALSGIAAFAALTTLWRGYALSSVGVAAPIAAVVAAVLPVLWDAVGGEVPGPLGWLGVVVGVVALVLTSWAPGTRNVRDGVVLGTIAGVCFAAMFLFAASTPEDVGTWPVVSQRVTAFAIAVLVGAAVRQRPFAPDAVSVRWSFLAGAVGSSGVAAVVYGGQRGPAAPVVIAGAMYPAVVIAWAWVFMGQALTRRQMVGLVAALVGVALIAAD